MKTSKKRWDLKIRVIAILGTILHVLLKDLNYTQSQSQSVVSTSLSRFFTATLIRVGGLVCLFKATFYTNPEGWGVIAQAIFYALGLILLFAGVCIGWLSHQARSGSEDVTYYVFTILLYSIILMGFAGSAGCILTATEDQTYTDRVTGESLSEDCTDVITTDDTTFRDELDWRTERLSQPLRNDTLQNGGCYDSAL